VLTLGIRYAVDAFLKFFAESPLAKVSIDLERKPDFGRKVDL
jgi:hypothetical protein